MQGQAIALPETENKPKTTLTVEVYQELYDAVAKECKRRKLTKRQVVEWGLKAFVQQSKAESKGD